MRVFLDTTVLLSAVATRGLAADVFRVVVTEHTLVTSEVVLGELRRVMKRKFKMSDEVIDEYEALLREYEVVPKPTKPVKYGVRDPDDQWVLASAIDGHVDVLVTGDKDLLGARRSPVRIVSPRGFWALLRGERR